MLLYRRGNEMSKPERGAVEQFKHDLASLPPIPDPRYLKAVLWIAVLLALASFLLATVTSSDTYSLLTFCLLSASTLALATVSFISLKRLSVLATATREYAESQYDRNTSLSLSISSISSDLHDVVEESDWSSQSLERTLPTMRVYERLLPDVQSTLSAWGALEQELKADLTPEQRQVLESVPNVNSYPTAETALMITLRQIKSDLRLMKQDIGSLATGVEQVNAETENQAETISNLTLVLEMFRDAWDRLVRPDREEQDERDIGASEANNETDGP